MSQTYPDPWPAPATGPVGPTAGDDTAVIGRYVPPGVHRSGAGRVAAAVAAVLVGLVVAATGPGLGWLWAQLAPRLPIIKVESGFVYAEAEPEQAVAADGWFAILGTAAGLVFAVLAWVLLRRYRGVAILVGLALGSLVAAALALWMGHKIGSAEFAAVRDAAAIGDRLNAPLGLRITNLDADRWWIPKPTGVAAVQALAAVFAYTCLAGFSSYADLRGPARGQPDPVWTYAPPAQFVPPVPEPPTPEGTLPPGPAPAERAPESTDQLGPGWTGSSEGATGTART